MSQGGSYTIDNFNSSLLDEPGVGTLSGQSFVVFSSSHPNQSRWYNSRVAHFVWHGKPNDVYAYTLDSDPLAVPSDEHTVRGTSVDVPLPGDGVFYFHLRALSGKSVAHYRVQVDTTPPNIVSIHLSSDRIVAGDVVRLSFDAQDSGSGVQLNYYVDLGSHLFLPVGSQLFVPFISAGDQKVTLRVYDNAGNYAEKTQIIHVDKPQ
jgi:hypothetical protein